MKLTALWDFTCSKFCGYHWHQEGKLYWLILLKQCEICFFWGKRKHSTPCFTILCVVDTIQSKRGNCYINKCHNFCWIKVTAFEHICNKHLNQWNQYQIRIYWTTNCHCPISRTATVWKNLNPFWGEEYTLHLPMGFHSLSFHVMDEDTIG